MKVRADSCNSLSCLGEPVYPKVTVENPYSYNAVKQNNVAKLVFAVVKKRFYTNRISFKPHHTPATS